MTCNLPPLNQLPFRRWQTLCVLSCLGVTGGLSGVWWLSLGSSAIAQAPPSTAETAPSRQILEQLLSLPSQYDLGLGYLSDRDRNWQVVEDDAPGKTGLTPPSLWWSRDQLTNSLGGYRLVRNWIAFRSASTQLNVVDVQVDSQYWDPQEDVEKYAILNRFGTAAKQYGYQLRLYRSFTVIGIYACDFSDYPAVTATSGQELSSQQLGEVPCDAALGPFIRFDEEAEETEGLFVPP